MRTRRVLLVLAALVSVSATGATDAAGAARPAAAADGHPAGTYSPAFVLSTFTNMVAYDVAAASDGTAYIGWISADTNNGPRLVHLCTLPVGASACTGGIQTTPSGDDIDARDLKVVVEANGTVVLVWQNITTASTGSARGDVIMAAFAPHGADLSMGNAMGDAPSYGDLESVQIDRTGVFWTLDHPRASSNGELSTALELRTNWVDPPQTLQTGYPVGSAQLAIAGTQPFVSFQKAGAVQEPDHWGTPTNGVWAFHSIPHTWTVDGNAALVETTHGPRIVTSIDNATYRPVLSEWTGSTFGPLHYTADRTDRTGCTPQTHDAYADASGRFLDASYECGNVTVSHFVNSQDSSALNLATGGTPTLAPQIASGTQGIATLVWTTQPTTGTSPLRLWVRRVRLPDVTHTVVSHSSSGALAVTAPTSCLPPVNVTVGVAVRAAKGWTLTGLSFKYERGALHSTDVIDGATLKPGTTYQLSATAKFSHGKSSGGGMGFVVPFTTCAAS